MQANNEDRNFLHPRTLVITGLVLAAAAIRLAPHPMNFAPIGALALFGGAYFPSKRQALIVPLLSLIIGDAITGFHPLIPFVYASFLVSAAIGFWLRRKRSATRIGVATLVGAMQFFLHVTSLAFRYSGTRWRVMRSMSHYFSAAWLWPNESSRRFANLSPSVKPNWISQSRHSANVPCRILGRT